MSISLRFRCDECAKWIRASACARSDYFLMFRRKRLPQVSFGWSIVVGHTVFSRMPDCQREKKKPKDMDSLADIDVRFSFSCSIEIRYFRFDFSFLFVFFFSLVVRMNCLITIFTLKNKCFSSIRSIRKSNLFVCASNVEFRDEQEIRSQIEIIFFCVSARNNFHLHRFIFNKIFLMRFFLFLKLSTTDTESLWRVLCYRCLPCAKTSPMCVNEAKHFECSLALVVSFSSTFFFVHVFVHMFYTKPKSIDRHWIWATARFSLFSIGVQRFRLSLFCIRGRRRQSMCISLSD